MATTPRDLLTTAMNAMMSDPGVKQAMDNAAKPFSEMGRVVAKDMNALEARIEALEEKVEKLTERLDNAPFGVCSG